MVERLLDRLDAVNEVIGRAVSLVICVMIAVVMFETVARYFFNAPTPWAHESSGWLQVAYIFLGGAFALQRGFLVRVDLIYSHLSPRAQALIDLTLGSVLFGLFAVVMIWKGTNFAYLSFKMGEISATEAWSGPVYPAKFMIPAGMILLTLAWLTRSCRQILLLLGRDTDR